MSSLDPTVATLSTIPSTLAPIVAVDYDLSSINPIDLAIHHFVC